MVMSFSSLERLRVHDGLVDRHAEVLLRLHHHLAVDLLHVAQRREKLGVVDGRDEVVVDHRQVVRVFGLSGHAAHSFLPLLTHVGILLVVCGRQRGDPQQGGGS
jgi:hypothetical protein